MVQLSTLISLNWEQMTLIQETKLFRNMYRAKREELIRVLINEGIPRDLLVKQTYQPSH